MFSDHVRYHTECLGKWQEQEERRWLEQEEEGEDVEREHKCPECRQTIQISAHCDGLPGPASPPTEHYTLREDQEARDKIKNVDSVKSACEFVKEYCFVREILVGVFVASAFLLRGWLLEFGPSYLVVSTTYLHRVVGIEIFDREFLTSNSGSKSKKLSTVSLGNASIDCADCSRICLVAGSE